MTSSDARLDRERILSTDADLEEVVSLLLREAINPRQMWMLFFDAQKRSAGPLMPCDDYPAHPDDPTLTEDLGELGFAAVLAHRIASLVELLEAESVVFVWERPGSPAFRAEDLEWARAMADACNALHVRVRAQFRLHDRGVRLLTVDDYGVALTT